MKIRSKLSLLFTFLTAAILLVFAATVYFSAANRRESEFYKSLKKEGITKANLYFNAQVNPATLQAIYKNNRETISEVEVAIYDTTFQLLYHDALEIGFVKETRNMIVDIEKNKEVKFYKDKWQVMGILFQNKGERYIVVATAFDQYGYNKLNSLRNTVIGVFICSILLIYLAGRYFSDRALSPVSDIVKKVKSITASNLDLRVDNANGKDEIAELSSTFNEMLDRLESSFEAQKQFVSNISHELRTPISALITELELALGKDRHDREYRSVIAYALSDAQKLAKLTNSLLDFAKANYDSSEISYKQVRVDEILLDGRQQIQKQFKDYVIEIDYESEFDNEEDISIYGNEYLLKVAFSNLMENGCKFSANKSSMVTIGILNDQVVLKFKDHGIGIPSQDIPHIFSPFYRGMNKKYADGNGIGLSLCSKIIDLHKGKISVQSQEGAGTEFTVTLEHL
jgi:two-component system, OmpR family, sensor histidine kinase ArlS